MRNFILLLCLLPIFAFSQSETEAPVCRISYFYGNVDKKVPPGEKWEKPFLDEAVTEGEWLKTGFDSKAELSIVDGSLLRIAENSYLQIEGLDAIGDPIITFKINMFLGRLWAKVKKLRRRSEFKIKNPIVVAGVRGTTYRMDFLPDSTTRLRVYNGTVAVSNEPLKARVEEHGKLQKPHKVTGPHPVKGPHEVSLKEWFVIVKAQQELWVGKDGKYKVSVFNLKEDSRDPWVKWNMERDSQMEGKK